MIFTAFIFCIIISALFKALMDTCASTFPSSRLRNLNPLFWDKSQSWRNKWKNGDPAQGERFPGGSTIFVSLTDGWHLMQHFFLFFMFAAFPLYHFLPALIVWQFWYITDFALIYAGFTLSFSLFYKLLNP